MGSILSFQYSGSPCCLGPVFPHSMSWILYCLSFHDYLKFLVAVTDYQQEEHRARHIHFSPHPQGNFTSSLHLQQKKKLLPLYIIKNSCHSKLVTVFYLKATSVSTSAARQREFKGDAQDPKVNHWHSYEQRQLCYLLQGHPSPFVSVLSVPMLIPNCKQKCVRLTCVVVTLLTVGPAWEYEDLFKKY